MSRKPTHYFGFLRFLQKGLQKRRRQLFKNSKICLSKTNQKISVSKGFSNCLCSRVWNTLFMRRLHPSLSDEVKLLNRWHLLCLVLEEWNSTVLWIGALYFAIETPWSVTAYLLYFNVKDARPTSGHFSWASHDSSNYIYYWYTVNSYFVSQGGIRARTWVMLPGA